MEVPRPSAGRTDQLRPVGVCRKGASGLVSRRLRDSSRAMRRCANDEAAGSPEGGSVKFAPGEVLVRRYWRGGRVTLMHVLRVAADDERGLRLWLPIGSPYWRLVAADGTHHHAVDQLPRARLARSTWAGSDVMIWMPDNKPYSVFWFWTAGLFSGWPATLEEPLCRSC